MVGISKQERKQLVDMIRKATSEKEATADQLRAMALKEGYSMITVDGIVGNLCSFKLLKLTRHKANDESQQETVTYKWIGE